MSEYRGNSARDFYSFPDDDELNNPAQTVRSRQASGGRPPVYRVAGEGGTLTRPQPALPPRPQSSQPGTGRVRAAVPAYTATVPEDTMMTADRRTASAARFHAPARASRSGWAVAGGLLLLALVGSYLLVSFALNLWQTWQDDMTYGRPRISRLEARVGHNETGPDSRTLFIAQNLGGQISIIEIPGSDSSKTRVIIGPQLFGKDRELIPIKLSVRDVNGDGQPDLIVTAQEQNLIYINDAGNFRPINEQERARLKSAG